MCKSHRRLHHSTLRLRVIQKKKNRELRTPNLSRHRKVDARLPGKGDSNSHGARPVHLIITIRTRRLSITNSPSGRGSVLQFDHDTRRGRANSAHIKQSRPYSGIPRKALRGGMSKSFFQRCCQLLATNGHKMAPRTSQGLQERAWDAPTMVLEWITQMDD